MTLIPIEVDSAWSQLCTGIVYIHAEALLNNLVSGARVRTWGVCPPGKIGSPNGEIDLRVIRPCRRNISSPVA